MMQQFRDFDAFYAELQGQGPEIKLFGAVHRLPASVAVEFILGWQALMRRPKGAPVPDAELVRLFRALYGEQLAATLFARGLQIGQLVDLLQWAMQAYGILPAPPATEPAPKASPAPVPPQPERPGQPRRKRRRR